MMAGQLFTTKNAVFHAPATYVTVVHNTITTQLQKRRHMFVPATSYLPLAQHQVGGCFTTVNNQVSSGADVDGNKRKATRLGGKFYKNEILHTDPQKYELLKSLGQGSFGQVFLSWNHTEHKYVAIKVLHDRKNTSEDASREIGFLQKLRTGNAHLFHIIQLEYAFRCKNQFCLVFEALEQNLFAFMWKRNFKPLPVHHIRPILNQILVGLTKLQELQIIHADLKLANIMIVHSQAGPYRIKIIDFGNALYFNEVNAFDNIQTLYYRSPEVILGAPFNAAIDMWSVGCIATALYLGTYLYKGNTSYDQIRLICATQGFPRQLLLRGRHTKKYFKGYENSIWLLKSPDEYESESGENTGDSCRHRFSSLNDLMQFSSVEDSYMITTKLLDKEAFIDLVKRMLTLNGCRRISPNEALQHPFMTLQNLHSYYADCAYVRECFEVLKFA